MHIFISFSLVRNKRNYGQNNPLTFVTHYNDITWASWHLKWPVARHIIQFIQANSPSPTFCERNAPKAGHYGDVIMSAMATQITSLTIVYITVYSGTDQRKHQSSALLAFVRGIHQWPANSPHKRPVTWKMCPFDDVIMWIYQRRVTSAEDVFIAWCHHVKFNSLLHIRRTFHNPWVGDSAKRRATATNFVTQLIK